jgi:ferritin-like protein
VRRRAADEQQNGVGFATVRRLLTRRLRRGDGILASEAFHEPESSLSTETKDLHRAITSLMEELEAVDWYQQRVDATSDEELASILGHNRDEEIEHAMMVLEWIRRRNPTFDAHARTYMFSSGPITEVEARVHRGENPAIEPGDAELRKSLDESGCLHIGSLRK